MAGGWKPDDVDVAALPTLARRMRERHQRLHEKVAYRRKHFYSDEDVDPSISGREGNQPDPEDPFRHIKGYQIDELRKSAAEFVLRVTENPWQFSVKPPDETQALERIANDIGQVMTYWAQDDEDRQGQKIIDAIAWAAVRDGYAIWHDTRCEHYWPEVDWEPGDGRGEMSEMEREVECPGCGGSGEDCPQCEGEGTITKSMLTLKGAPKSYVETVTREYADRGSPWMWGVDDVLNIAWEEDKDPRGGFKRLLVTYEIDASEYESEVGPEMLRTALPLPGVSLGTYSVGTDTPNFGASGEERRVQVNQLWTRTHYYEWVDQAGDGWLVKHGRHNYAAIPYSRVAPMDTGHPDLVWRFQSPLDGLYHVKEWADRTITLMSGVVENQARPQMVDNLADPSVSPLTADGSPAEDGEGTVAARYAPPGVTTTVITQPMPASIPDFWREIKQMVQEAKPDTGKVEVGSSSAAWTVRLGQQQASTQPRRFVDHVAASLQQAMNRRLKWHMDNSQRMIGYGQSSKNKPVVIMPEELRNMKLEVFINPVSGTERITVIEHNRGLLAEQLILPRDFYEAMGEEDPDDAATRVQAYYMAAPYRDAAAKAAMAKEMGSVFLLGPQLELLDAQGNGVSPEQVLQAKGYGVGGAQGGGGGMPGNMLSQMRQQVQMPDLQPLERNQPGVPEQTTGMMG